MSEIYEAWSDENGTTFTTREKIIEQKKDGLLSKTAEHLHTIEASNWEEAMTAHHLKMGFEPYNGPSRKL